MIPEEISKLNEELEDQSDRSHRLSVLLITWALFHTQKPVASRAPMQFGEALRKVGLTDYARKVLLESSHSSDDRFLVELSLGHLYRDRCEFGDAEKSYKAATGLRPESTTPWIYLGALYMRFEKFDQACEAFNRATKAKGDVDEAYLNLGLCRFAQGDLAAAKRCFEEAIKITADYADASHALEDVNESIRLGRAIGIKIHEGMRIDWTMGRG